MHQVYLSPPGPTMTVAMPVYQAGEGGQAPTFLGAIGLDFKPLAIILDILMPHKDGWQVLHELKADVATQDIPVIVLTATTCTAEEQELLHARVRTVIQKQGLERHSLLQEVRAALLADRATTEEQ